MIGRRVQDFYTVEKNLGIDAPTKSKVLAHLFSNVLFHSFGGVIFKAVEVRMVPGPEGNGSLIPFEIGCNESAAVRCG